MKPQITRGHNVQFRVTVAGRSSLAAVQEALVLLREAGVPMDAGWRMSYHKGEEKREKQPNGEPYMESDYIQVEATWAEQS